MFPPISERSRNSRHYKNKIIFKTAAVSFLLLSFQGFMGVKFECPCSNWWNQFITLLILIVPAIFGWIMLSLFLRFEEQSNSEDGGVQTDNRRRSESEKWLYYTICGIPSLLWLCIFFIDGDYFACLLTNWNGTYTCDTNIHPNCVSWCKPEPNEGGNETQIFKYTQKINNISKIIGYILAAVFCGLIGIIMQKSKDKNRTLSPVDIQYNALTETVMMNFKRD